MRKQTRFLSRSRTNPVNPGQAFPIEEIRASKKRRIRKSLKILEEYVRTKRKPQDFPHTIIFDWNGTVDARNTGIGIPLSVLVALKNLGKNVIVFTSSVNSPGKLFMRQVLMQHGIPYTDSPEILKKGDIFVADKHSDEKKAGHYGIKFVPVQDFSIDKVVTNK